MSSEIDINPVLLEVFKNRFSSIAEEMGMSLIRTAFSANIKERRDLSCAIFDADGQMVAQASHIPVHLGSMPLSVHSAIANISMDEGDMVILNDPFDGGTHLPDITLVAPVYVDNSDAPIFYVANRAHHSDVGGMSSGSMPLSTSIFQEGIIIPTTHFVQRHKIDRSLLNLLLRNVRTPEEREGDIAAQIMANRSGIGRIQEMINAYGLEQVCKYAKTLIDYSEKVLRQTILEIPDGQYTFEDVMDDDGMGTSSIPIHCELTISKDMARLDFTKTADQVSGSINAVRGITLSCVLYVFRCLVAQDIPTNAGCMLPLEVVTRKGSLVDAIFPASVAGGNVETSQRIVDVILGALALSIPEKIPSASQGTMNNLAIGGYDHRSGQPFSYYETIGGGMGASVHGPGESAVHSHMTNTLNTPVEALEISYPFRVHKYAIRRQTGGQGKYAGGDGLIREIEVLTPCEVTVLSERRTHAPYALEGGLQGALGRNSVLREWGQEELPGKFHTLLQSHDRVRVETPGGGGYGRFVDPSQKNL